MEKIIKTDIFVYDTKRVVEWIIFWHINLQKIKECRPLKLKIFKILFSTFSTSELYPSASKNTIFDKTFSRRIWRLQCSGMCHITAGTKVPAFQNNLLHPSLGLKKDTMGSSKMLVIYAKHHGVTPHKTICLVSYPVHKTPNPISLTAICMKIQSFLTYDAV
jgi:hypothetical protein